MLFLLTGHTPLRFRVCRALARSFACGGPCTAKTFRPGAPRKAKMMAARALCTVEGSCTRISDIFETARFFQLQLMATTAVQENGVARPGRAGDSNSTGTTRAVEVSKKSGWTRGWLKKHRNDANSRDLDARVTQPAPERRELLKYRGKAAGRAGGSKSTGTTRTRETWTRG